VASLLALAPASAAEITGQFRLTDARGVALRSAEGVAAWLEPVQGRAPIPASGTHTITQKGKRFSPHVSVVPVGTLVDLPNYDPIFHNAFSNFAGQPFDTGLYAPGTTHKVRFQREGIVRVFCNIHATMSAVIVVVPSPWYAVAGASGAFRISEVPAGEYVFKVWHERATEPILKAFERRITVGVNVAIPLVEISEDGFVAVPHVNKYGKPYGKPPEDQAYGGKR
jgi:plastocyanin